MGETALTCTPRGPHSNASTCVGPSSPYLLVRKVIGQGYHRCLRSDVNNLPVPPIEGVTAHAFERINTAFKFTVTGADARAFYLDDDFTGAGFRNR